MKRLLWFFYMGYFLILYINNSTGATIISESCTTSRSEDNRRGFANFKANHPNIEIIRVDTILPSNTTFDAVGLTYPMDTLRHHFSSTCDWALECIEWECLPVTQST